MWNAQILYNVSHGTVGLLMFAKDAVSVKYSGDVIQFRDVPDLGIEVDEAYVKEITSFSCEIE